MLMLISSFDSGISVVISAPAIFRFTAVRKTASFFECFPYVCPEPVLVKCSFLYINGGKMPFCAGDEPGAPPQVR
jgi:hypothetical protein